MVREEARWKFFELKVGSGIPVQPEHGFGGGGVQ